MEPVNRPNSTVLLVVGIFIALVAGVAAGWLIRSIEIGDLKERIAALEEAVTTPTPAAEETETVTPPPEAPPTEEPATDEAAPTVEKQPGIIKQVTEAGGRYRLRIDYIQFLTGDEAADAATAAGDESPPPNDYYIVNENPRIREFPIASGIDVTVVFNDDETSAVDGRTMPLADWADAFNDVHIGAYKANFYWVTITDGTVTAIEQQFLP